MKNLLLVLIFFVSTLSFAVEKSQLELLQITCNSSNNVHDYYGKEVYMCYQKGFNYLINRYSLEQSYLLRLVNNSCSAIIYYTNFRTLCYDYGTYLLTENRLSPQEIIKTLCDHVAYGEDSSRCFSAALATEHIPVIVKKDVQAEVLINSWIDIGYSSSYTNYCDKSLYEIKKKEVFEKAFEKCQLGGITCNIDSATYKVIRSKKHTRFHEGAAMYAGCSMEVIFDLAL